MKVELSGGWRVAQYPHTTFDHDMPVTDGLPFIRASVPRAVHYDLMEAGILGNVYGGHENAKAAQWVSHADWVYETSFELDADSFEKGMVQIHFECIDTFADVFVNGRLIGSSDDMFMPWTFDVPKEARLARNTLTVHIKGHRRMVETKGDENVRRIATYGQEELARERTLVRRYQRSYNTDFLGGGISIQGIGLTRPVYLLLHSHPRLDQPVFAVLDADEKQATLEISAAILPWDGSPLTMEGTLSLDGVRKHAFRGVATEGKIVLHTKMDTPALWWPHGSGEQTLYELRLILSEGDTVYDEVVRHVGIRKSQLRLQTGTGRQDFQFVINGTPIPVRGANWIPLDMLNATGSPEAAEAMLQLVKNANMNMLRLWGGGTEEPDWFYGRCDELGIMIWQDAFMHSQTYPDYDGEFVRHMREEAAGIVTRLRSHPCFTIFCGGNEQEEGWDTWNWKATHAQFHGAQIIYETLPEVARHFCPEIPYIPNSPYGDKVSQSPVDGDTHTWGNFYNATEDPLFVTETCWYDGTISRPESLEKLLGINADDYTGLRWNERFQTLTAHTLYRVNQYTEYHQVDCLRNYTHTLEVEQMRADYAALYLLRTRSSSCRGILYWPLNKGGPMMNYGAVDYCGRPLMPYYGLVRLFRDTVVHGYRDVSDLCVVACNDSVRCQGTLTVRHMTVEGRVLNTYTADFDLPHTNHSCLARLEGWYDRVVNRWREYVHIALFSPDGTLISEDTVYFCPFAEVEMEDARLSGTIGAIGEGEWDLTLSAGAFTKLVEIECPARMMYTDNYFFLTPGQTRTIRARPLEPLQKAPVFTAMAIDRPEKIKLFAGEA